MNPRTLKTAILFAVTAVLTANPANAIEPRSFAPGSLIIPTDNCWQGDIAQPTLSKEAQPGGDALNCAGATGSNSAHANGARRAYGLVWQLLQAGVPIYWIINPNKQNIDDPDLTIDVGSCSSGVDAVRLVDQSVPASACGMDSLHPKDIPSNLLGSVFGQCQTGAYQLGGGQSVGTYKLGSNPQTAINYRGGPFVIDSTNAALARDVMAWYFPNTSAAPFAPPSGPYTAGYLAYSPMDAAGWGTTTGYIDPGHHPLHWSQYTPSAFVPLYPPFAFSVDISGHVPFAPCSGSLCPFTTWDPLSADGHVDPWGNMSVPDQNAIEYATVNVHQAQFAFTAPVGQLINQPIPPIALAGITDPIHTNTFRFYLEEAGLTFGPCNGLPPGWQSPGSVGFGSYVPGSTDLFFDPYNYPFPDNFGAVYATPYSKVSAQCAEGIASDDPNFLAFDPTYDGGVPLAPSAGGGPYGKVLDIIAPEFGAFRDLLKTEGAGQIGCGAPRYSQLWIPHWDATLQTGPTTTGDPVLGTPTDPLAATMSAGGTCPIAGNAQGGTPIAGKCAWNPQLVQTILDDAAIYVAHGGNLLAECIGAASLEDFTMGQLLGQFTLPAVANMLVSGQPINQHTSHFMTEFDPLAAMTAYAPSLYYQLKGATVPVRNTPTTTIVSTLATTCMDNPSTPVLSSTVTFTPLATAVANPATAYNPIGYPGSQVMTLPSGALSGGSTAYAGVQAAAYQFNTETVNGGTDPDTDGGSGVHLVEYAPALSLASGGTSQAKLSDPFLQVGDFYFLGVHGASESYTESANADAGFLTHGYALSPTNSDTQILIRGLAGLGPSGSPTVDTTYSTTPTNVNNSVIGDYWIKNHSQAPGAGTVVYLQGDSFDGHPDGLRMVWSSILNLSFVASGRELSRSSPQGYEAPGVHAVSPATDTWLLAGSFEQDNIDYGRYSPTYLSQNDTSSFIFPPERGHLRAADMGLYGTADINQCFTGGTVNHTSSECQAQVGGDAGTNTVAFLGVMQGAIAVGNYTSGWDTSEVLPAVTATNSLLLNSAEGSGAAAGPFVPQFNLNERTIFTHLYQPGPGAGLALVSLSPYSGALNLGTLLNALFPEHVGPTVPNVPSPLACPKGSGGPCIVEVPFCGQTCSAAAPTPAVAPSALTATDVEGLLTVVNQSNGGCSPLLQDSCYPVNSSQVQCLDACWSSCLDTCVPTPATPTSLAQNTPPFSTSCQSCGFSCAQTCNEGAAGCGGASCCGVNSSPDVASFRETCFPSIGGVDHSTPVIVAQPSASITETMNIGGSSYSAGCRPTVAYVGAADGMLHAIFLAPGPASDTLGNPCSTTARGTSTAISPGQELWAFVPNQNLPLLHTGGDCTRSLFVDGVPVVKDVYANLTSAASTAPSWHTILTETLGQGGGHVFALDVTDPLAPIRSAAGSYWTGGPIINFASMATPFVLWEQGDPLDGNDYHPTYSSTGVQWPLPTGTSPYADSPTEGPGLAASPLLPNSTTRTFNHYLGGASTVFMGNLIGSGAQQSVTYVAGQSTTSDSYSGALTLRPCTGVNCNQKDFGNHANYGIPVAPPALQKYGPAGEVVYAFDSATGVPRADPTTIGLTAEHFAMQYLQAPSGLTGTRSDGNNDIPAPLLGASTTGKPETDILVVPDLDGQVWGLQPASLISTVTYSATAAPPIPFPLFDIQRYYGNGARFATVGLSPGYASTWVPQLLSQAAFANAPALLPPGACPGTGNGSNDTVAILATGGVDWGPEASVVVALDLNVNDFQSGGTGPTQALYNGSAAELLPVNTTVGAKTNIEVPTCEGFQLTHYSECVGRVFGQPLVVGSGVYFNTNTGLLTGQGSGVDQTSGDGTISTLGNASCSSTSGVGTCSICDTTEQSVDLQTGVGKMASGLTAIAGAAGTMQVFGASTTGVSNINVTQPTAVTPNLYQKLALQQWWLRPQRPSCPSAGDSSCTK